MKCNKPNKAEFLAKVNAKMYYWIKGKTLFLRHEKSNQEVSKLTVIIHIEKWREGEKTPN